jgi:hypothetical protein
MPSLLLTAELELPPCPTSLQPNSGEPSRDGAAKSEKAPSSDLRGEGVKVMTVAQEPQSPARLSGWRQQETFGSFHVPDLRSFRHLPPGRSGRVEWIPPEEPHNSCSVALPLVRKHHLSPDEPGKALKGFDDLAEQFAVFGGHDHAQLGIESYQPGDELAHYHGKSLVRANPRLATRCRFPRGLQSGPGGSSSSCQLLLGARGPDAGGLRVGHGDGRSARAAPRADLGFSPGFGHLLRRSAAGKRSCE